MLSNLAKKRLYDSISHEQFVKVYEADVLKEASAPKQNPDEKKSKKEDERDARLAVGAAARVGDVFVKHARHPTEAKYVFTVTWSPSFNATHYNVQMLEGAFSTFQDFWSGAATSCVIESTSRGGDFSFRVVAINQYGRAAPSRQTNVDGLPDMLSAAERAEVREIYIIYIYIHYKKIQNKNK